MSHFSHFPRVEIFNSHPPGAKGGPRGDPFAIRRTDRKEPVRYLRSDCEGFIVKQGPQRG